MWEIQLRFNNLIVTPQCAQQLFEYGRQHLFYDIDDVVSASYTLKFHPEHFNHMDYLIDKRVQKILLSHSTTGRAIFSDFYENNTQFLWGYRFDGQKCINMKHLECVNFLQDLRSGVLTNNHVDTRRTLQQKKIEKEKTLSRIKAFKNWGFLLCWIAFWSILLYVYHIA